VPELLAVDPVTVAQEIGGRGVIRERLHDLLSGPEGCRVLGHVEVDDAAAMVRKHDEDEQDAQARGGHGEEVDGDQVLDMVGEEGPPGLRWLGAPLRHQAGHGALCYVDPELDELAMNARGAPQRVGGSDMRDQSSDRRVDRRPTGHRAGRELGPVVSEAPPLPP
jgi:hypothetical protein